MKVARTVLKERCPQVIEASTLIKNLQGRSQGLFSDTLGFRHCDKDRIFKWYLSSYNDKKDMILW